MVEDRHFDNFHDMPFLLTRNDTVVDVGNTFLQLTGYAKENILQRTIYDVIHNLLRINIDIEELTDVQDEKYYYAFTKFFEVIEVNISIHDYPDFNEKYYIFSEKHSFNMSNNMAFFEKLFNDNHYGIAVFSATDFILLKYNQKYGYYLGEPFNKREKCIGFMLKDLIFDFEGSESEKMWTDIINTGETVYLEEVNNGIGDMKGRYWDNTISPIAIDSKVKYIVSMIIDVTEKVEAKKCVEEQSKIIIQKNRELEAIIENMGDFISIIDKNGDYLKFNKAQRERLMPYAKLEDCLDNTEFYEFDGSEIPQEETVYSRVLMGEKFKNRKVLVKKDGKEIYYDISGIPITGEDGSFSKGILIHDDITELIQKSKLIEQQKEELLKSQMEKNEILEKAIEMKDEFLSLVSHEFRTPLNVINTAIQTLYSIYDDELTDKVREYMGTIMQNTNRQLRLVNNLLDITRANAGRIKVHKKNIDIVFLTKAITESVYQFAYQKGVRITFVSSLKKKIIGIDDEKYERILLNLISNAIKFTPEGKSIIVKLRSVKGNICVEVKDTGIGIPPNKIDLIFERFGQVDSSLSRQAEGTGIGLSLVKKFVETFGGSISVRSKVGKGSTFTVLLPGKTVIEEFYENPKADLMDNRLVQTANIEFSDIYF